MRQEGGGQEGQAKPSTPLELNSATLQLTMKWIEHASEASELAVSDTRLAEVQARAIGQFFNVLRDTIKAGFGSEPAREEPKQDTPSPGRPAERSGETVAATSAASGAAPA